MKSKKLAIPYMLWMLVFTMIPLVMIGFTAFTDNSGSFSLSAFADAFQYTNVFLKSLWIALISTIICLIIAYPLAYMISQMKKSTQNTVIMLVMIPMWMNFLLRIYAWVLLLQSGGPLDTLLSAIGIHGNYNNNTVAVIVGVGVLVACGFSLLVMVTVAFRLSSVIVTESLSAVTVYAKAGSLLTGLPSSSTSAT